MSIAHAAVAFKKQNSALTKQITAKVDGNVELQTLVLDYIDTYHKAAQEAQESGASLASLMMSKRKKATFQPDEDLRPVLDAQSPLAKNCSSYRVWRQKLLAELLCSAGSSPRC